MATTKTALIFGVGSRIGAALVQGFLSAGYRVASVSRSVPAASAPNTLAIQADLSDPAAVPGVYARLAAAGWSFPTLVVWNAANWSAPTAEGNPLEVPLEAFDADLGVMVRSPYVAAREAVRGWRKEAGRSGSGRKGTFVMTGNWLPRRIMKVPSLVDLGVGKAGANYWVGLSDVVFREEGMRFFFADQRTPDGEPVGSKPDGEGHAKFYLSLVEDDQLPHYVTFVGGKYQELP